LDPPSSPEERRELLVRFAREAEALASVDHPLVCRVVKFSVDEAFPYLVMPYYPQSLEGVLKKLGGRFDDHKEPVRLLEQVAEGLAALHRQNLVHRDVKPANILIDKMGRPVVSDVGLVKNLDATDSLTPSGAVLGTPAYVAPEQVNPELKDARGRV